MIKKLSILCIFLLMMNETGIITSADSTHGTLIKTVEDGTCFSSVVRVRFPEDGRIEKMHIEDYLVGVLMGEVYADQSFESLKAMAVAARSYTLYMCKRYQKREYDVEADASVSQAYIDVDGAVEAMSSYEYEKYAVMKKAVESTKGLAAFYGGEVICALYHASSMNATENSENVFIEELPYLKSVASYENKNEAYYNEVSYSAAEMCALLFEKGYPNLCPDEISMRIYQNNNGRCNGIYFFDSNVGFTVDKNAVRGLFGLRSTLFEVDSGEVITFKVYGFGHGVGLSQNGADIMGSMGYCYEEIIKHYYSGAKIQKTIYN